MNQREWKANGNVALSAASKITADSGAKWTARYDIRASYTDATYYIKYYLSDSSSKPLAECNTPFDSLYTIEMFSAIAGNNQQSASFKGWKMRRESDGRWYAQDKAGGRRYVGLVDGKLPDGYDFCLLKDGARILKAAPAGSGVSLYAQLD